VPLAHPWHLAGQQRVIGSKNVARRRSISAARRLLAGEVDRLVGERARRDKLGVVRARIERRARGSRFRSTT
jgi:hypothetical protein